MSDPGVDAALEPLSDEQRQTLHAFWLDRAAGELTTALSFEYMLDDLRNLGAPTSLQVLAERCIREEHWHADYCVQWARRISPRGEARARLVGTRPARFDGASDHDNRILRTVFGCCFSETVATEILLASHDGIAVDAVRELNRQHVKEEVHHARLGWALLAWPGLVRRDREMIGAHVPALVQLTLDVWTSTERAPDALLEALGYLPTPVVARGCREAFTSVVLPGLAHHGVPHSELKNSTRSDSSDSVASA